MMTTADMHPTTTGPGWVDQDGNPARVICCPDCGQLEWWTDTECGDHGRCRTGRYACACDG